MSGIYQETNQANIKYLKKFSNTIFLEYEKTKKSLIIRYPIFIKKSKLNFKQGSRIFYLESRIKISWLRYRIKKKSAHHHIDILFQIWKKGTKYIIFDGSRIFYLESRKKEILTFDLLNEPNSEFLIKFPLEPSIRNLKNTLLLNLLKKNCIRVFLFRR